MDSLESNPDILSDRTSDLRWWGDAEEPRRASAWAVRVETVRGETSDVRSFPRKSVQGDRATGRSPMLDQPALAWGASSLATGGTGQIGSGDGSKQPTVKSSTMRGAKALASKFCVRRCRNVNGVGWPVRGSFLLLPPEIIGLIESDGKYGAAGAAAYSQGPEG